MNQTEFNKKELYEKLLDEAFKKGLTHTFVLSEFKRNRWNLNESQAVDIANKLDENVSNILYTAYDMNILNVSNKVKKELLKQRKNGDI